MVHARPQVRVRSHPRPGQADLGFPNPSPSEPPALLYPYSQEFEVPDRPRRIAGHESVSNDRARRGGKRVDRDQDRIISNQSGIFISQRRRRAYGAYAIGSLTSDRSAFSSWESEFGIYHTPPYRTVPSPEEKKSKGRKEEITSIFRSAIIDHLIQTVGQRVR